MKKKIIFAFSIIFLLGSNIISAQTTRDVSMEEPEYVENSEAELNDGTIGEKVDIQTDGYIDVVVEYTLKHS